MANTVFIALQCCQCSMMQVKQKKKNSNKWICSVCNQRQSVRKVFAHGDFAKDLRKFVQEFNWNQKDQTLTLDQELKEEEGEGAGKLGFESRIETETPNKKIKLNKNSGSGSDVSKWNGYITQDDDMEPNTCPKAKAAAAAASKWDQYITTEEDDEEQRRTTMAKGDSNWSYLKQVDSKVDGSTSGGKQGTRRPAVMGKMNSASKWNYYLTQEEDKDQRTRQQQPAVIKQSASKWDYYFTQEEDDDQSNGVFKTITQDQPVEDDIHPDFI